MPTLAIDIGGTKTAAALINNDDAFLEHATWPSPPTAAQAIERVTAGGPSNSGGIAFINSPKPEEARCAFSASSSAKTSYNHTMFASSGSIDTMNNSLPGSSAKPSPREF